MDPVSLGVGAAAGAVIASALWVLWPAIMPPSPPMPPAPPSSPNP